MFLSEGQVMGARHCKGSLHRVYAGKRQGEQQQFAVKIFFPIENAERNFERQYKYLAALNHKNLCKMVDSEKQAKVVLEAQGQFKTPLIIEQLAVIDLFDIICSGGPIEASVCRYYARTILDALHYLHERKVAHRDLKPENILFGHDYELKIADFGMAIQTQRDNSPLVFHGRVGTDGYRPPQMHKEGYEGDKADIFSVGVILLFMYSRQIPFSQRDKKYQQYYRLIQNGKFKQFWSQFGQKKPPNFFSDKFKSLIQSLLQPNPTQRATLQDLRTNQWLNGDLPNAQKRLEYMRMRTAVKDQPSLELKKDLCKIIQKLKLQITQQIDDRNNSQGLRSRDQREQIKSNAIKHYLESEGQFTDLDTFDSPKAFYIDQNPEVVYSVLAEYLQLSHSRKDIFTDIFCQHFEPIKYQIRKSMNKMSGFEVVLTFKEQEGETTILIIEGLFHRSSANRLGIYWTLISGNYYWFCDVRDSLNSALKVLRQAK